MTIRGIEKKLKLKGYPSLIYLYIFLATMLVSTLIFWLLGLFHTNIETAHYLLSALVQSEAAIIAIVITLSLVAVQLTASSYSPRVIDIFKESNDLKIVMGSYIFSMMVGFIVLKNISDIYGVCDEFFISLSLFLGFYCFVALVPYISNTLTTLNPLVLINKFSQEITKVTLLEADPILPTFKIIERFIRSDYNDYNIVEQGLNIVKNRICSIFEKETFNFREDGSISLGIFNHFDELYKLALEKKDDITLQILIKNIEAIELKAIERKYENIIDRGIGSLEVIGRSTIDEFTFRSIQTVGSLGVIGESLKKDKVKYQNKIDRIINILEIIKNRGNEISNGHVISTSDYYIRQLKNS